MTEEEKKEEEEVTKQEEEEEEEVEAEEEEEVREEERREGEKIYQTNEEEDREMVEVLQNETELPTEEEEEEELREEEEEEEVDVLQNETELSSKLLPFSSTCYIVTSPMFTLGESVPLGRAEQGIVRFVGYPHFKEGVWIGVELEQQRRYTMFIPVRKVASLNEERDAGEEKKEREEEWRVEGEMFQRDEEEEQGEKVDVLQKRTELPPDLLTFSATCDLFTAAMFNPGQQVLVAGERGIVKFVSHTHLKEGVWIGVEPVKQKEKHDGSINGQRHSNCSPWYAMFIPVGKVPLLNKKVEEEREKAGEEEEREKEWRGEEEILQRNEEEDSTFPAFIPFSPPSLPHPRSPPFSTPPSPSPSLPHLPSPPSSPPPKVTPPPGSPPSHLSMTL